MAEKTYRRLPLRELLTDAEKRTRDLTEQVGTHWTARAADLRELSRPVRRRSHYPTLLALLNAMERMFEVQEETEEMADYLLRELDEIREHARRERLSRQG
jgi:hypothetical protein